MFIDGVQPVEQLAICLAATVTPLLVVVENLISISPSAAVMLTQLMKTPDRIVIAIASASSSRDDLKPWLIPRLFSHGFLIPAPSESCRYAILRHLTLFCAVEDSDLVYCAAQAHGYLPGDLVKLVREATIRENIENRFEDYRKEDVLLESEKLNVDSSLGKFLKLALSEMAPSALATYTSKVPRVLESDIFGMEETISYLDRAFVTQARRGEWCKLPRGVLLSGPPGCGKTLLAQHLTTRLCFNSIVVDASQVISKIVGASERNVVRLFEAAQSAAPCVLLIDQVEMLCGKRDVGDINSAHSTAERTVTCFLAEFDMHAANDDLVVIVIASTCVVYIFMCIFILNKILPVSKN